MRYRMRGLLVALVLAGGCGPSEPVQDEIEDAGTRTPADTDTAAPADIPLVEPEPQPASTESTAPANNEIPLLEPEGPLEPAADDQPDAAISEPPQADASEIDPGDETARAEGGPANEEAVAHDEDQPKRLISLAIEAADGGDFASAIGHLESVLQNDPNNRDALYVLGVAQLSEADQLDRFGEAEKANPLYLRADATLDKLQRAHPDFELNPRLVWSVRFGSARAYARTGNGDEAMVMLQAAAEGGFADVNRLTEESDLETIRERPEFKTLVVNLAETQAKELLATHEPFDFAFLLKDLDGQPVALQDYQGKVVLVDIWGTWCGPCRKEVPHLIELHQNYRDQGFEIVGINDERNLGLSAEEAPPVIREFADQFGITYTCVIADDATLEKVPNFEGYPTKLLIDRNGTVRAKLVGYRSYHQLEAFVKLLLNERVAEATRSGADPTNVAD